MSDRAQQQYKTVDRFRQEIFETGLREYDSLSIEKSYQSMDDYADKKSKTIIVAVPSSDLYNRLVAFQNAGLGRPVDEETAVTIVFHIGSKAIFGPDGTPRESGPLSTPPADNSSGTKMGTTKNSGNPAKSTSITENREGAHSMTGEDKVPQGYLRIAFMSDKEGNEFYERNLPNVRPDRTLSPPEREKKLREMTERTRNSRILLASLRH